MVGCGCGVATASASTRPDEDTTPDLGVEALDHRIEEAFR